MGSNAGGGLVAVGDVGCHAGVGLALLGLGSAFLLGAKHNPLSLIFTLGGFLALILLAQAVASRPELIDGIGVRLVTWFNSLRGKPADTGLDKWRQTLEQLESVNLSRRQLGAAFLWSLFTLVAGVATLLLRPTRREEGRRRWAWPSPSPRREPSDRSR